MNTPNAAPRRGARRTGRALWLLLVTVALMGSICPTQHYHAVSLTPVEGRKQSWDRAIDDWSRRHKVYWWMDDKIDARATYHSPVVKKAFLDNRTQFYGEVRDIAKKEVVDLGGGEAESFHSFFVSTYVGWQKYRSLTHAHTIWTLSLTNNEGVRVEATRVKDVRLNPAVQAIYPYVNARYDKAYLVRFPLADESGRPIISSTTRSFTLHVDSAYAKAQLVWDLVPSGTPEGYGIPRDAGPTPDSGKPKDDEGGFGLGKLFGG